MIHYSSNIALEKLVVEQLIEGPKGSKLKATLPGTTKLINVSVADRICYLTLTLRSEILLTIADRGCGAVFDS